MEPNPLPTDTDPTKNDTETCQIICHGHFSTDESPGRTIEYFYDADTDEILAAQSRVEISYANPETASIETQSITARLKPVEKIWRQGLRDLLRLYDEQVPTIIAEAREVLREQSAQRVREEKDAMRQLKDLNEHIRRPPLMLPKARS